jgi:hypothetical protein
MGEITIRQAQDLVNLSESEPHWRYLHSLIIPRSSLSAAYPVLSFVSSNTTT